MQNISHFAAIHRHPLRKKRSIYSRARAECREGERDDASLSPRRQRGSVSSSPQHARLIVTLIAATTLSSRRSTFCRQSGRRRSGALGLRRSAPPATAGPQHAPAARGGPAAPAERTPRVFVLIFRKRLSRGNVRAFPAPQGGFPVQAPSLPRPLQAPPPLLAPGGSEPSGPDSGRTPRPRSAGSGIRGPGRNCGQRGGGAGAGGERPAGLRRSGLTSSLTRGCSLPRSWAQGRRCRLWSWPRTSSGRLCGSASPAFAWNSSCTFAIFLPAARPGPARPHGSAPPPSAGCEGRGATAAPGGRTGHGRRAGGSAGPGCERRLSARGSAEQRRAGRWRERPRCLCLSAAVLVLPRGSRTSWKPLFPYHRSYQGWKWCKIIVGMEWKRLREDKHQTERASTDMARTEGRAIDNLDWIAAN